MAAGGLGVAFLLSGLLMARLGVPGRWSGPQNGGIGNGRPAVWTANLTIFLAYRWRRCGRI